MIRRDRLVAALCTLSLAAGAPSFETVPATADPTPEISQLRGEIGRLEVSSQQLLRRIPSSLDKVGIAERLEALGRRAELGSIEIVGEASGERLHYPDGQPTALEVFRLSVSGMNAFEHVYSFLVYVSRSATLLAFENLRIETATDDVVSFELRLAIPIYSGAPETTFGGARGEFEAELREELERQRALYELLSDLASRPAAPLLDSLGVLQERLWQRALFLTRVTVEGGWIDLEGLTMGYAAGASLATELESAGLGVASVETSAAGDCRTFAVRARRTEREVPMVGVMGNGLFTESTPDVCRVAAAPFLGSARAPSVNDGDLTIQLHDGDLAHVFQVLHGLTGESFVVDRELRGRLHLHAEDAALGGILEAIASVGVRISDDRIRRVTAPGVSVEPLAEEEWAGDPVTLEATDLDLNNLLCTVGGMWGLEVLVRREANVRITAFVDGLAVDHVLSSILAMAHLTASLVDGRLYVGSASELTEIGALDATTGWVDSCETQTRGDRGLLELSEHAISDLRLTSLARSDGRWLAHARGMNRGLLSLAAGNRLLDGTVESVDSRGVRLRSTDGQAAWLTLPD